MGIRNQSTVLTRPKFKTKLSYTICFVPEDQRRRRVPRPLQTFLSPSLTGYWLDLDLKVCYDCTLYFKHTHSHTLSSVHLLSSGSQHRTTPLLYQYLSEIYNFLICLYLYPEWIRFPLVPLVFLYETIRFWFFYYISHSLVFYFFRIIYLLCFIPLL